MQPSPAAGFISADNARRVAQQVATTLRFVWADETVSARLDEHSLDRPCWRVTLWPAATLDIPAWNVPNDVVTDLPPEIFVDACTSEFVGLQPRRGAFIAAKNLASSLRSDER